MALTQTIKERVRDEYGREDYADVAHVRRDLSDEETDWYEYLVQQGELYEFPNDGRRMVGVTDDHR